MYIRDIIDKINKTHSGLGELVAMCQLTITAHKMLLIVSPSGCGKSTAMKYVSSYYRENVWTTDSTSRAGLGKHVDELSHSTKTVVVDDLSTTQTSYARASTMTALAALCYTHEVHSDMGGEGNSFAIDEFEGSVLVGVQPKILRELLIAPEWEGTIKDKVIRYYHIKRPIVPNLKFPPVELIRPKLDIKEVAEFEPDANYIVWQKLVTLGLMEFSRARTKEHLLDYLKASAVLDGRTKVDDCDYELLEYLFRPLALEVITVDKTELEGEGVLNSNLLLLLAEYHSFGGQFSLAQVAVDHKVTIQQAYRIMKQEHIFWDEVSKSPTVFRPTKYLYNLLKKYHLEIDL